MPALAAETRTLGLSSPIPVSKAMAHLTAAAHRLLGVMPADDGTPSFSPAQVGNELKDILY